MAKIGFFSESVSFNIKQKKVVKDWVLSVVESELFHVKQVVFVFCDDAFLLNMNNKHLGHNYYTDILTFDLSEKRGLIETEIYISLERVLENSMHLQVDFSEELYRVMVHGILHLVGYRDKTKAEKQVMRAKENKYIYSELLFHVKQKYKTKKYFV